jgi:hypothetical protein
MLPEAAAGGAMGYFMSDRWIRPQNHDGRTGGSAIQDSGEKRNFLLRYLDDESKSWIYFFIPEYSEKIVSFFNRYPVIVHTKDGLRGLVGSSGNSKFAVEDEIELYKKYYSPGLESLLVLTPNAEKVMELPFENKS